MAKQLLQRFPAALCQSEIAQIAQRLDKHPLVALRDVHGEVNLSAVVRIAVATWWADWEKGEVIDPQDYVAVAERYVTAGLSQPAMTQISVSVQTASDIQALGIALRDLGVEIPNLRVRRGGGYNRPLIAYLAVMRLASRPLPRK